MQQAHDRMQDEIDRQTDALRDVAHRQRAALDAVLEPIGELVARLEEGLETLSLYIGRGEQIFTIRDGDRADALEPIVIRQMVLAMDEETGLLAESEGINADSVQEFDRWLLASEAHVEQIVPERRCVVAMVPRFTPRQRGDMRDHDDTLTHLIIRNGEALFRTSVRFSAGDVLIPRASEFVQFFYRDQFDWEAKETRRVALAPGTPGYQRALEQSDARSRHYLRIGLILQGLVDRTEIFAPIHPAGVNMLTDPHEHSSKVRIITDAEGGLDSGEQTFQQWREAVNAQLRVGMRVVGGFDGADWREVNDGRDREHNLRLNPSGWTAERPQTGVPYVIEAQRSDGGLVIRYPRHNAVYRHGYAEPATRRASCTVYRSDAFVLPYDAVDADTLERFLRSRRNRRGYQTLWPLLTTVMLAKRAEETAEAPFRQMLAGVLARDTNVTVAAAEGDVGELVRWFKLANRYHRPLVSSRDLSADEAKAVRLIVAEYKRRLKDRRRPVDQRVVAALRAAHPEFLVIARPRSRGYLVLEREDHRPVFVREVEYSAKGTLVAEKRWQLVGARAERWLIVAEAPAWGDWDRMASPREHLTGPEVTSIIEQITATAGQRDEPLMAITQREVDGPFYAWVVDERTVFDPAHPLTGDLEEPSQKMLTVRWQRKGHDQPTVVIPRHGSEFHTGPDENRPWETAQDGYYATRVLHCDEQAVREWARERLRYQDAQAFTEPLAAIAQRARESLHRAWLARETQIARGAFLATGHEEDWPEHAATLKLEWPYERHRWDRRRHSEVVVDQAIDWALERGFWLHGATVAEAFDAAVNAGLRGGWVPVSGRDGSTQWDEDAIPELEDRVADLTFVLTAIPPAALEDDQPPPEPDDDDRGEAPVDGVDELVDDLRGRIADALAPEPADEVIASGPGYEVLDRDRDAAEPDSDGS